MLKEIKTEKDIEELMKAYENFHDSCVVNIKYESGLKVNEDSAMEFPKTGEGHKMTVTFQSQIVAKTLELYFKGVRRFYLSALTDNYTNEIFEGKICFINGDKKLILWSDDINFDLNKININLPKPQESFIVSDTLSYKII